jgi:histidinol-phosphate aminotransferase
MIHLEKLVRPNILQLDPYSTARHEYSGVADIYLDANENAFGSPINTAANTALNRYPDPMQTALKQRLSEIKGLPTQHIFIGNGSDEAIDLVQRIFCEPGTDNIIICPPTYGMYKVCATINNIQVHEVPLTSNYQLDLNAISSTIDEYTKLIFVCSPNNPTGNSINRADIVGLLSNYNGIVVIDEAYINYSKQQSFVKELTEYNNLIVMQTLSKAWGLAALRVGMAFSSSPIIELMNKVKYPYNVNIASQELALEALQELEKVNNWTAEVIQLRENLANQLLDKGLCLGIQESDANFLLVHFDRADELYKFLCTKQIIVRDRSRITQCLNCLRITIGTQTEIEKLLQAIQNFYQQN